MHVQPGRGTSAVIMNPPQLSPSVTLFAPRAFFLLHTQADGFSAPAVLSRISLTSYHSSIHTPAHSQTLHATYYVSESLGTHSYPVNTPYSFLFPALAVCTPPEATKVLFAVQGSMFMCHFKGTHLHNRGISKIVVS